MSSPLDILVQKILSLSWQVSVLALLVWFAGRFFRKAPAQFRYCLWCLVLLRCCFPFSLPLPVGWDDFLPQAALTETMTMPRAVSTERLIQLEGARAEDVRSSMSHAQPPETKKSLSQMIAAFWFIGACTSLGLVGLQYWRTKTTLKKAAPVQTPELSGLMTQLGHKLQMRRIPECRLASAESGMAGPAVIGLWNPCILLPPDLLRWPKENLEPILLHELAHIRRLDTAVNWFQIILQAVFFFHPVIWWANHQIRKEREMAVDDFVVRHLEGKEDVYCRSILNLLNEHVSGSVFSSLGITETKTEIGSRLLRLMKKEHQTRMKRMHLSVIALLGGIALSLGSEKIASPEPNPVPEQAITEATSEEYDSVFQAAEEGDTEAQAKLQLFKRATSPPVKMEAKFAEVTEASARKLKLDWLLTASHSKRSIPASFSAQTAILTRKQSEQLLADLQETPGVDLLSSPIITTLSGRFAQILMEEQKNVVTGVKVNAGQVVYHTRQMSFGPDLKALPYVYADGYSIQLTLKARVKEFLGYAKSGDSLQTATGLKYNTPKPTVRTRQIHTTALVYDGQTVVLTGGWTAGAPNATEKEGPRKCLLVFITPTILSAEGKPVHRSDDRPFDPESIPSPARTVTLNQIQPKK